MSFSFNLVNSNTVAIGKIWAEKLIKSGGSDVTKIGEDGIAHRVFDPWLSKATIEDRERVAGIIISAIQTGKPLKAVAKELEKIPVMQTYDTQVIAYQETRFLLNSGIIQRFRNEGIEKGIWHTLDKQEKEHFVMDEMTFELDDPVWNRMYEGGCKCWCEPVTGHRR